MGKIRAVMFDFDGTLQTGDKVDLIMRLNDAVHELGMNLTDHEVIRVATSSPDFNEMVRALVLLSKDRIEQPVDEERFRQYHKEKVSGRYDHLIRPFPDVTPVLTRLKEEGYKCGLVTTRGGHSLARLLQTHGFSSYFEGAIVHRENCSERKPHPAPLQIGLRLLGFEPDQAVYVGDSQHDDIGAAHAAGITSVLRCQSVPTKDTGLQQPHYCIKSLHELPAILRSI